ncbi:hypothetical protein QBC39DRAFT_350818 [Podospora conica]|nr:hypothetical protein QBC39DRAFT_350818 [Schizothecium conicum]
MDGEEKNYRMMGDGHDKPPLSAIKEREQEWRRTDLLPQVRGVLRSFFRRRRHRKQPISRAWKGGSRLDGTVMTGGSCGEQADGYPRIPLSAYGTPTTERETDYSWKGKERDQYCTSFIIPFFLFFSFGVGFVVSLGDLGDTGVGWMDGWKWWHTQKLGTAAGGGRRYGRLFGFGFIAIRVGRRNCFCCIWSVGFDFCFLLESGCGRPNTFDIFADVC